MRAAAIQTALFSPVRGTRAPMTCVAGFRRQLQALFDLSRGYTEQQEWVWSLSSTLGREVIKRERGETRRTERVVKVEMGIR